VSRLRDSRGRFIKNPNAKTAKEVEENLDDLTMSMLRAAAGALYIEGTEIMNDALKITPFDTGNLRDSHYVELPKPTSSGMVVKLGFGGTAAPYALAVHERTDEGINWSEPGTGPKFLERALDKRAGSLARNIQDRMRLIIASNRIPPPPKTGE
tara:strand:- start:127 stop:588 length:462 start_codon:yes stop_codon:yes gene_type:complete